MGTVAIDLEPALPVANTCSTVGGGTAGIDAGDVTSVLNNVALNTPFFIDIVVDSVPAPGTSGLGLDFGFNGSIMRVNAVIANPAIPPIIAAGPLYFCTGGVTPFGPVVVPTTPTTSSPLRIDVGDLGGTDETGPGRVLTIQIECLATGTSFLTLSDVNTGGNGIGPGGSNTIAILGPALANPYPVTTELEATVGCNTTAGTPTPAPTASPTPAPTASPSPSPTPSPTPAPTPTASPTGTPAATSTATPSPTATAAPSATPGGGTPTPTATPTAAPTGTPETTTPATTATPANTATATAALWGDNNCSGKADSADSLIALLFNTGLSTNTGDCPKLGADIDVLNASPHIWGDVDCGGEVTLVDTLALLRFDAELDVAQAPGCPGMGTSVTIVEA